jgi:hypothetical protein
MCFLHQHTIFAPMSIAIMNRTGSFLAGFGIGIFYETSFLRICSVHEGLPAVPGHEAYWEDRDERDLGPAAPDTMARR